MGEPFDAIGFKVTGQAAYQALAEEARAHGVLSRAPREQSTLHGCCWRLGEGLEVWAILNESKEGFFYADCRPAFRGRHTLALFPWEITEYEDDGEATVRALVERGGAEVIFELQNITEINPAVFRERALTVTVAGLAYRARINARAVAPALTPLAQAAPRKQAAENDYLVRGQVLYWREIKNPRTESELVWLYVDAGKLRLEVVISRADLKGELRRGASVTAEVWLQGHILSEEELRARYEGVDAESPPGSFWERFRREN